MAIEIDGEAITPQEANGAGWTNVFNYRKNGNTKTNQGEPRANVERRQPAQGRGKGTAILSKQKLARAARMPPLPRGQYRIVVRPRGGLDITKLDHAAVGAALTAAAGLSDATTDDDTVCPNKAQNIWVISTPMEANARAYSKITSFRIGEREYDAHAYATPMDDMCKGVIHKVDPSHTQEQLRNLLVHHRNPSIVDVRRIKESGTVIILFTGTRVPNYVLMGKVLTNCYLYRKQWDVCHACGKVGHRADVCPAPEDAICRGCGAPNPTEEHTCDPTCRLCGGAHPTASKQCRKRYQVPYPVRQRQWKRRQQASTDDSPKFKKVDFPALGGQDVNERQSRAPKRDPSSSRARSRSKSAGRSQSRGPGNRNPATKPGPTWADQAKQSKPQVREGTQSELSQLLASINDLKKQNAALMEELRRQRQENVQLKAEIERTQSGPEHDLSVDMEDEPIIADSNAETQIPPAKKRAKRGAPADLETTLLEKMSILLDAKFNQLEHRIDIKIDAKIAQLDAKFEDRLTKIEAPLDTETTVDLATGSTYHYARQALNEAETNSNSPLLRPATLGRTPPPGKHGP